MLVADRRMTPDSVRVTVSELAAFPENCTTWLTQIDTQAVVKDRSSWWTFTTHKQSSYRNEGITYEDLIHVSSHPSILSCGGWACWA